MNENILCKWCCSKKSLQVYRKHVNRNTISALKNEQKTSACERKNSIQYVPYLKKTAEKLSVGLSWITAESSLFFPEANGWRFRRILSHPLTICSLEYTLLVIIEECEPAAPWVQESPGCPQAGQARPSSWRQLQPLASGTSLGTCRCRGWARTWAHRWAGLGLLGLTVDKGCGDLETSPAVGSMGQGLKAYGGLKQGPGPWAGVQRGPR